MNKAGYIFLTIVIFIFTSTAIILPCFASSSDSELSFDNVKPVDFTSWADVPEDYKALGEAYLDLFSDGTDSIFKNLSDIPISWLKLVNDINPVISPLDGLYFFLNGKEVKAVQVEPSGTPKGIDALKNRRIPSRTFKERLEANDAEYSPKNGTGKMSYRTDSFYQNIYSFYPNTFRNYNFARLFENYEFCAVNGDEIYLILFYKTDSDCYYSKYQFHLYFDIIENWATDRDEIESYTHNLIIEYWDNVEGSKDNAKSITFDLSDKPFCSLYLTGSNSLLRYYDTWLNYNKCSGHEYSKPSGSDLDNYTLISTNYTTTLNCGNVFSHFAKDYDTHDPTCSFGGNCDFGYIASSSPISTMYNVDTTKIPDDAIITVGGDNIYNYYITNPDTGESSTMNEYITNNYTYITNNNGGGEGSGSGCAVGGNVTVGGEIAVGGQVGVDINVSVPDININVNGNNSGGAVTLPDTDLVEYLPEAPKGFIDYLTVLFSFLPPEVLVLIIAAIAAAITCRAWGR